MIIISTTQRNKMNKLQPIHDIEKKIVTVKAIKGILISFHCAKKDNSDL